MNRKSIFYKKLIYQAVYKNINEIMKTMCPPSFLSSERLYENSCTWTKCSTSKLIM